MTRSSWACATPRRMETPSPFAWNAAGAEVDAASVAALDGAASLLGTSNAVAVCALKTLGMSLRGQALGIRAMGLTIPGRVAPPPPIAPREIEIGSLPRSRRATRKPALSRWIVQPDERTGYGVLHLHVEPGAAVPREAHDRAATLLSIAGRAVVRAQQEGDDPRTLIAAPGRAGHLPTGSLHDIVADVSRGFDALMVVGPSATGPSAGAAWKATIEELRALSDRVAQRAVVAQAGARQRRPRGWPPENDALVDEFYIDFSTGGFQPRTDDRGGGAGVAAISITKSLRPCARYGRVGPLCARRPEGVRCDAMAEWKETV